MKTKTKQFGKQPQNKSTFVRTRNQANDIPVSASKIKKRIRDVKRTLNKGKHISAQVITESKRRLHALEFELGEKIIDEAERTNSIRYHKVKFLERKKVQRKIKKAKANLAAETDETKKAALQDKLDDLEIKALYINHYPKTLPYASLFAGETEEGDEEDEEQIEEDKSDKNKARQNKILKDIKDSLLNGDKDLELMNKRYREEYKQKLIQRGDIQPVEVIDEGADVVVKEEKKEEAEDDFFE
ncbi:hypothetical protein BD770DRAFT_413871 [Pilaira anomala]|nr:hypothetical protein BD770DRAFT_413871 [Pilaira anomala]